MNLWKVSVELSDEERGSSFPPATFLIAIVAAITPKAARTAVIELGIVGVSGIEQHRSVVNQLGYSTSNKAEVVTWGYHTAGAHRVE